MNGSLAKNNLLRPESVFKECVFRVPDYQRGYSWEKQQRDELLEDIELLPDGKAHYTGTLVFNPVVDEKRTEDKRGNSYSVLDLVDGQQRLITLVVLLDAVASSLKAEGKSDLAAGLQDLYVAVTDPNGEALPKMTLNKDCHDFFFQLVVKGVPPVGGPIIRSHVNLLNSYQEFRAYLAAWKEKKGDDYVNWLMSFRKKVCEQLRFTVYVVDEASEVGVIFEVMNNRGLHITELEKVKNYLLYLSSKLQVKAPHNLAELVNQTWTFIFESLMRCGLGDTESEDRLLRMHWIMAYDYQVKNWHGSKSIKEKFHLRSYVGNHEGLLADLKQYVAGLKDAAVAFCDIESPNRPDSFKGLAGDPELRRRIVRNAERLVRLGVLSPFTPLLMAVRLRLRNNAEAYLRALELCETFSFRVCTMLERRADAGRSTFYLIANSLFEGAVADTQALNMVAALAYKYSPKEDFDRACELRDENDWYSWRGLMYFLYEYEEFMAKDTPVRIPWSMLERADAKKETVEHILPQTPKEGEWTEFSEVGRKKFTHDIGNLCLTFDNSNYGRKTFDKKKGNAGDTTPCYANGKLCMERALAALDHWDVHVLLQRREQIIAWARERWMLPALAAGTETVSVDAEETEPLSDQASES